IIREDILKVNTNVNYVTDVLIEYSYGHKESNFKTTLWSSFGDIIVENIKKNIDLKINEGYIQCTECNKLIKPTNNKNKYCKECAREVWKKYNAQKQREYYYKNKDSV
ncbi:MAG TPA: hypothetical protein GX708_22425, partial [Gallicola sp.]|nr:hypothetical protein [Gallicola sp.]